MSEGGTFSALMDAQEQPKQPVEQPSNQATTLATKQPKHKRLKTVVVDESGDASNVEVIRRAVKQLGKETSSYRLHKDEKAALDDMLYVFKKQGIKTNENEIVRIAVNYLINDYQENGKTSILLTVLERLNA